MYVTIHELVLITGWYIRVRASGLQCQWFSIACHRSIGVLPLIMDIWLQQLC
jgi:hypothetical protein